MPAMHGAARKPIPEQDFLRGLINWGSKVACIGAHGSPVADPSPLFLAQHTKSKSVTIVDCKDTKLARSLREKLAEKKRDVRLGRQRLIPLAKKIGRLGKGEKLHTGVGGLKSFREDIAVLGAPKKGIRLQPGLAWDTGIKPGSLDLVLDRGTMAFLHVQGKGVQENALHHYLTLLKAKGRLVLIVPHGEEYHYWDALAELNRMKKTGEISMGMIPLKSTGFEIGEQTEYPNRYAAQAIIITMRRKPAQ